MSKQQPSTTTQKKRPFWRKDRKASSAQKPGNYVTHKELKGFKFVPSLQIPDSNPRPWYPLVVTATTSPGDWTLTQVYQYMLIQLDPDATSMKEFIHGTVLIRIQSVEVWNLTGKAVSLTVWELPAQDYSDSNAGYTYDQIGGWTDAGGANSFPRIGYRYPYSVSGIGHICTNTSGNNAKVITTTASSGSDSVLHRFHILWRVPGPVKYTTVLPRSPSTQYLADASASSAERIVKEDAAHSESNSKRIVSKIVPVLKEILAKIPVNEELSSLLERLEFPDHED